MAPPPPAGAWTPAAAPPPAAAAPPPAAGAWTPAAPPHEPEPWPPDPAPPAAPAFGGYQPARTAPWGSSGPQARPVDPGRRGASGGPRRPGAGTGAADRWAEPARRGPGRRRRVVVTGLVVTALAAAVFARSGVESAVKGGGRALGILTGDATGLDPDLVAPAGPGSPGSTSGDPDATGAPPGGPTATVVAPGSDGIVGTDDDVVVPAPGSRGPSSSAGGDQTTVTTRVTTSTSTTLPPIPTDLAIASVEVPSTAPGSTDACGQAVAFDAGRMVDDKTDTAWRMEGDGTGQSITLSLGGSHRIVSVGMIPGYALTDPCDGTDRFAQNRRITKVTWTFDDGSAPVVQDLREVAEMQRVAVSAQATTVTVRIEGVSGEPERDFTAISEIDVRGT